MCRLYLKKKKIIEHSVNQSLFYGPKKLCFLITISYYFLSTFFLFNGNIVLTEIVITLMFLLFRGKKSLKYKHDNLSFGIIEKREESDVTQNEIIIYMCVRIELCSEIGVMCFSVQ